MSNRIPPGFIPMDIGSAFIAHAGPIYIKQSNDGFIFGMRIEKYHTNLRGIAHGAAIMLLVDVALGYATAHSHVPKLQVMTTHLSADFASAAYLGDWIEAHVDIFKIGTKMAFANAYVTKEEKRLVRSSAIISIA